MVFSFNLEDGIGSIIMYTVVKEKQEIQSFSSEEEVIEKVYDLVDAESIIIQHPTIKIIQQ